MKQQVGKAWQEIFPQAGGSGWPQVGVLPRVSFVVCGAAPPRLPFGLFPRVVLITGEGNGNPLQCSCLENPRDGRAWWAAVHGVAKSWTRLSNFTFTLHFHTLEKEMATHSSVLAWRIPGTGEPGGLLSVGSHRVGRN